MDGWRCWHEEEERRERQEREYGERELKRKVKEKWLMLPWEELWIPGWWRPDWWWTILLELPTKHFRHICWNVVSFWGGGKNCLLFPKFFAESECLCLCLQSNTELTLDCQTEPGLCQGHLCARPVWNGTTGSDPRAAERRKSSGSKVGKPEHLYRYPVCPEKWALLGLLWSACFIHKSLLGLLV